MYQNKKVLLYLFERLPGVSFAYFKWSDEGCDGGKAEGKTANVEIVMLMRMT